MGLLEVAAAAAAAAAQPPRGAPSRSPCPCAWVGVGPEAGWEVPCWRWPHSPVPNFHGVANDPPEPLAPFPFPLAPP
eukprot:14955533-Alexandrium_andersonii.AAC.1